MNHNLNKTSNYDDGQLVKLEFKRKEFPLWQKNSKKYIYLRIFESSCIGIILTQLNQTLITYIIGLIVLLYIWSMTFCIWKRDKIILLQAKIQLEEQIKQEMIKTGRRV